MSTFQKLFTEQKPESQWRIIEKSEAILREILLNKLHEELFLSQTEMARKQGKLQPTLAKIEKTENDPRLSTLKRYVKGLGGEISLNVTLSNGKQVAFEL